MENPHETPSTAETLDASPFRAGTDGRFHKRMALIEGSTPHLTDETQDLLRSRLRASALVLFLGFFAFLIKGLFSLADERTEIPWRVFSAHVVVTLILGAMSLGLCRKCPMSLRKLRVTELLVFGGPACFFILLQFSVCEHCMHKGLIPNMSPPWLLLIFTYALFVPNAWRRAAAVVGSMAAAPVLLATYLAIMCPPFAELIRSMPDIYGNYLLELTMLMALAFAVATFGVHAIRKLRHEAFEAKQLGRYRLKEQLGSGGMGEVYLAEHQLMKRPCAIKVIRPEKAGDPQVLARFEREVRATAKLSHWNSIEIFDYGSSEDGTFYYVMEYLPGMNLAQLVERHGPLPAERVIHLISQTCDALSEAHAQGLIHRDIKPSNMFAAHRGGIFDVAKLLDFGLAKPLAENNSVALTQEGMITGSPLYMSPEQVTDDRPPDARSDIYSLGAVMYFLLTGQPPFGGDKPMRVMIAHAHDEVLPPTQIRPEIPVDLELVVLRCLTKQAEERFETAESLRQALVACEAAGRWTRQSAANWWRDYGCPNRRAFEQAALEAAAV